MMIEQSINLTPACIPLDVVNRINEQTINNAYIAMDITCAIGVVLGLIAGYLITRHIYKKRP